MRRRHLNKEVPKNDKEADGSLNEAEEKQNPIKASFFKANRLHFPQEILKKELSPSEPIIFQRFNPVYHSANTKPKPISTSNFSTPRNMEESQSTFPKVGRSSLVGSFREVVDIEEGIDHHKFMKSFITTNLSGNNTTRKEMKKTMTQLELKTIDQARKIYKQHLYMNKISSRYRVVPTKNFSGLIFPKPKYADQIHDKARAGTPRVSEQKEEEQEKDPFVLVRKTEGFFVQKVSIWNYKQESDYMKYRPESREGATLTLAGSRVYLFGGVSNKAFSEVYFFDLSNFPSSFIIPLRFFLLNKAEKNEWQKELGTELTPGRAFHSAFFSHNKIVIFGGESKYNDQTKSRELLNDIRTFRIDQKDWEMTVTTGNLIEPRSAHASCVFGRFFFVSGGIIPGDKTSNELFCCDIFTKKWQKVVTFPEMPQRRFHACAPVFKDTEQLSTIFKNAEETEQEGGYFGGGGSKQYPKQPGLYFFGGLDQVGEPSSDLSIVRFNGNKQLGFIPSVPTKGTKPIARYQHTMNYFSELGFLAIYGGKNHLIYRNEKSETSLNDLQLLNILNMSWCEVSQLNSPERIPRAGHCSFHQGTRLYLFGGSNLQNNLIDTTMESLELDSFKSKQLSESQMATAKLEIKGAVGNVISLLQLPGDLNQIQIRKGRKETSQPKEAQEIIKEIEEIGQTMQPIPDLFDSRRFLVEKQKQTAQWAKKKTGGLPRISHNK